MTVVAALARHGEITMAADTCTNYVGTEILGAKKIRRITVGHTPALMACSGNGAMLGVLQREWHLDQAPDPDDPDDVLAWANTAASAATEILAGTTPPLTDTGQDTTSIDGAILLGWHGLLIYMFTHQAVIVPDGIAGLGSGTDIAIGVLHASTRRAPQKATTHAVTVACQYMPGCRVGPTGPQVEHLAAEGVGGTP